MKTIITAGGMATERDTKVYNVPLFMVDETLVEIIATGKNQITEPLARVDMVATAEMFDEREVEITRPVW